MNKEQYVKMTDLAYKYAKEQGDEEFESSYEDYTKGYEAAFALGNISKRCPKCSEEMECGSCYNDTFPM